MYFKKYYIVAVFMISSFSLLFYQIITYRQHFHSDAAVKNIFAQEIFDSGKLFPPEWFYGTSDVWIVSSHLFIVPLLKFIPNGFLAHSISSVIFSFIFLISSWFFLSRSSMDRWWVFLTLSVLLAGISPYISEVIFGMVAPGYAWMLVYLFVLFATVPRMVLQFENVLKYKLNFLFSYSLIFMILFVGGLSGLRMFFSVVSPFAFIGFILIVYNFLNNKQVYPVFFVIAAILIPNMLGYAVNKTYLNTLHVVSLENATVFVDFGRVVDNLKIFAEGFLLNSGIYISKYSTGTFFNYYSYNVFSIKGFEFVYRIILNVFIFSLPWYILIFKWKRELNFNLRCMILYYISSFVLTFILFVFTDSFAITFASIRYFSILFVISYAILLFWLMDMDFVKQSFRYKFICFLVLCPLLVFSWSHQVASAYNFDSKSSLVRKLNKFDGLIQFLNDNNLRHGFASFCQIIKYQFDLSGYLKMEYFQCMYYLQEIII